MKAKFGKRKGLQGPFEYPNGRVLYFDVKENQYYDPLTDYYVEDDEVNSLKQQFFDIIGSENA